MARWQPLRTDVIAEYAREVLEVHPRGRLLVGLDGIEDPAGTEPADREGFADDLAAAFVELEVPAAAVRMAAFAVEPRATTPERFFDEAAFRSTVLVPYRAGALPGLEAERTALVVSGPFLHLPPYAGMWHTSAWLQLPRQEALARDAARLPGVDRAAWTALVGVAFRRVDARKVANATFDLTDAAHPRREFEDAC